MSSQWPTQSSPVPCWYWRCHPEFNKRAVRPPWSTQAWDLSRSSTAILQRLTLRLLSAILLVKKITHPRVTV